MTGSLQEAGWVDACPSKKIARIFKTHSCVLYKQTAAESYEGLQLALGLDYPEQALFVTDSMSEADAARSACWLVVLAVRPGNAPLPEHTTPVITNFEELDAQW